MNLISFDRMEPEKGYMLLRDFRKEDNNKILIIRTQRTGAMSNQTLNRNSGFMQYIFKKSMRVNLPRTSSEMATVGRAVSRADLQPGDMVFFSPGGRRISHVGMYIGNGRMVHAPRTGKNIEITSIASGYWAKYYTTARRVSNSDRFR